MSDCFDHEFDAMMSLEDDDDEEPIYPFRKREKVCKRRGAKIFKMKEENKISNIPIYRTLNTLLNKAHVKGQDEYMDGLSDDVMSKNIAEFDAAKGAHIFEIDKLRRELAEAQSRLSCIIEDKNHLGRELNKMGAKIKEIHDVLPMPEFIQDHDPEAVSVFKRIYKILGDI